MIAISYMIEKYNIFLSQYFYFLLFIFIFIFTLPYPPSLLILCYLTQNKLNKIQKIQIQTKSHSPHQTQAKMRKLSKKTSQILKLDSYNWIREQLQAQNSQLMEQRQHIRKVLGTNQDIQSFKTITLTEQSLGRDDNLYFPSSNKSNKSNKNIESKDEKIKSKINQIIQFCVKKLNDPKSKAPKELREIIQAEQQILKYIQNLHFPSALEQIRPRSSATLGESKRTISHHKQKSPQFQQQWQNRKSGIRQAFKSQGFQPIISDSIMQMIEQIQRKTLNQIQKLRNDKISLLTKLNKEIKQNNSDKKLIMNLQKQNALMKRQLGGYGWRSATFGPIALGNNSSISEVEEQQEDGDGDESKNVKSKNSFNFNNVLGSQSSILSRNTNTRKTIQRQSNKNIGDSVNSRNRRNFQQQGQGQRDKYKQPSREKQRQMMQQRKQQQEQTSVQSIRSQRQKQQQQQKIMPNVRSNTNTNMKNNEENPNPKIFQKQNQNRNNDNPRQHSLPSHPLPNHYPHSQNHKNPENVNVRHMSPQPYRQQQRQYFYYPEIPLTSSEQNLQTELSRLQQQNRRIRSSLAQAQQPQQQSSSHYHYNNPASTFSQQIKEKLRLELKYLQQQILKYQQIIQNNHRRISSPQYNNCNDEDQQNYSILFREGENLCQQGQNLNSMKKQQMFHNSNMQKYKGRRQMEDNRAQVYEKMSNSRKQQFIKEINFLRNRIFALKKENQDLIELQSQKQKEGEVQQNSRHRNPQRFYSLQQKQKYNRSMNMEKSYQLEKQQQYPAHAYNSPSRPNNSSTRILFDANPSRFYSPNPAGNRANFSPNKYEVLIGEMKKAIQY